MHYHRTLGAIRRVKLNTPTLRYYLHLTEPVKNRIYIATTVVHPLTPRDTLLFCTVLGEVKKITESVNIGDGCCGIRIPSIATSCEKPSIGGTFTLQPCHSCCKIKNALKWWRYENTWTIPATSGPRCKRAIAAQNHKLAPKQRTTKQIRSFWWRRITQILKLCVDKIMAVSKVQVKEEFGSL